MFDFLKPKEPESPMIVKTGKVSAVDLLRKGYEAEKAQSSATSQTTATTPEQTARAQKFADIRANADKRTWETETKPKDQFLEGFNYYSEKKEEPKKVTMEMRPVNTFLQPLAVRNKYADSKVVEKPKDDFLEGFYYYDEEKKPQTVVESAKKKETNVFETVKNKFADGLNAASAWANKAGILDDVTNGIVKAYDYYWDSPAKYLINPGSALTTDLAHHIIANKNYKENKKQFLDGYEKDGGYITDQNLAMPQIRNIRYGVMDATFNGCEPIAINNALRTLGDREDIRDIMKELETDGQLLFGLFGTSPYTAGDYFRKRGYEVDTYEGDKTIYNLDVPDADTYIMSYWNKDKLTEGIHTVSVDKLSNGKYKIYNEGDNGIEYAETLNEFFRKNSSVPLVLHCIKKGRR